LGNIKLWEKNKLDFDTPGASITITDAVASDTGSSFVGLMRDRSNDTGWATTGSTDAALTQVDVDLGDAYSVDQIILANMNFDAYTLQYHDGATFVDFSTAISVTGNTATTKYHAFTAVSASLYRLIIQGTIIADSDKILSQFIITKVVGTFAKQPNISKFQFDQERKSTKLLSGRRHIVRKIGGITVVMEFKPNKTQADQDLLLDLHNSNEGRLINFVGGDDSTHGFIVAGFRNQDIFLMTVNSELDTSHFEDRYANGNAMKVELSEAL